MRANIAIESDVVGQPLVIVDIGPWEAAPTVTNDAEAVVERLFALGQLNEDRRLFYYDSEGDYAEIVHEGAAFVRFAPAVASVRPVFTVVSPGYRELLATTDKVLESLAFRDQPTSSIIVPRADMDALAAARALCTDPPPRSPETIG